MDACWDDLKVKYRAASKKVNPEGETLFVIWYGGHGEMGGSATTQICCDSQDPSRRLYPWEKNLMMLTEMPKTYTLAFFDCCRLQNNQNITIRGGLSETPGQFKFIFAC